jgi:histidine triad (HIT) family protein
MYNHAPENYLCPFCLFVRKIEDESVLSRPEDLVFQNDAVTAIISAHWWPNNAGHVVVIPNEHYENIYDLPLELAGRIHEVAQKTALAMKKGYLCEGISTRQHNEPAGSQDVWHYHLHVFPRYRGDGLYGSRRRFAEAEERAKYARILRQYL